MASIQEAKREKHTLCRLPVFLQNSVGLELVWAPLDLSLNRAPSSQGQNPSSNLPVSA